MAECCKTCRYRLKLVKYDYSHGGCKHEDMDGYVCMSFAHEGVACWMVGLDENTGFCECYKPKEVSTK